MEARFLIASALSACAWLVACGDDAAGAAGQGGAGAVGNAGGAGASEPTAGAGGAGGAVPPLSCAIEPEPGAFYAAPNGTPAGDGTEANPWDLATAVAADQLPLGATLYLRGGTYQGSRSSSFRFM